MTEYGKVGADDRPVIDECLSKLKPGAVVVNLGCGPNIQGELHELARSLGRHQFRSTLILADLWVESLHDKVWVPGPERVEVVELNAANASHVLGCESADIVIALGLFGALSSTTTSDGTGDMAWPSVLRECARILKPGGVLIVSNSVDRQDISLFVAACEQVGLEPTYQHVSPAVWGPEKVNDHRYLLLLRRK